MLGNLEYGINIYRQRMTTWYCQQKGPKQLEENRIFHSTINEAIEDYFQFTESLPLLNMPNPTPAPAHPLGDTSGQPTPLGAQIP